MNSHEKYLSFETITKQHDTVQKVNTKRSIFFSEAGVIMCSYIITAAVTMGLVVQLALLKTQTDLTLVCTIILQFESLFYTYWLLHQNTVETMYLYRMS